MKVISHEDIECKGEQNLLGWSSLLSVINKFKILMIKNYKKYLKKDVNSKWEY